LRFPLPRWRKRSPVPPFERALRLSRQLISRAGQAEGTKVANELAATLLSLSAEELLNFFHWLVSDLAPEPEQLMEAASSYVAQPNVAAAARLTRAAEPRRQELLRRLNTASGGTALIVSLRERLLSELRRHPELEPLEWDMRHLLASWFNRGFLKLRRVDWNTPAAILEKLIAYEAVHAIRDWDDLRGRLEGERRCYAFFHPSLRDDPLIFIEVAFTRTMSSTVAPLLEADSEREGAAPPKFAIFYSISNCQRGLRGISFGNFLIKQIVEELRVENPSLEVFATLSPVPGFRAWLDEAGLSDAENSDSHGRNDLITRCAIYLTGDSGSQGRDPVASFHLANGARLERINCGADLSDKGRLQSCGLMVNYRYFPDEIEENHEAFVERGEVRMSPQIRALVQNGSHRIF
jgi:malonyl-CoA decarboxylase